MWHNLDLKTLKKSAKSRLITFFGCFVIGASVKTHLKHKSKLRKAKRKQKRLRKRRERVQVNLQRVSSFNSELLSVLSELTLKKLRHLLCTKQVTVQDLVVTYFHKLKTSACDLVSEVNLEESLSEAQSLQKELDTLTPRSPLHGAPVIIDKRLSKVPSFISLLKAKGAVVIAQSTRRSRSSVTGPIPSCVLLVQLNCAFATVSLEHFGEVKQAAGICGVASCCSSRVFDFQEILGIQSQCALICNRIKDLNKVIRTLCEDSCVVWNLQPKALRVGFVQEHPDHPVPFRFQKVMHQGIAKLTNLDYQVIGINFEFLESMTLNALAIILSSNLIKKQKGLLEKLVPKPVKKLASWVKEKTCRDLESLQPGSLTKLSTKYYSKHLKSLKNYRQRIINIWKEQGLEALIVPFSFSSILEANETLTAQQVIYFSIASVLGFPSVCLDFTEKMPVENYNYSTELHSGFQLISLPFNEENLLRILKELVK